MELRELRYFVAAAEAGSLTAAAAQLHLSQPPLTVAIRKLENELGTPLFVRSSRGVEPTSAGRFLLDAASRVLGEVDDIVAGVQRFSAGTVGSLTMAAVPAVIWHWVPRLLREHAVRAPHVEVQLVDPPPWEAIELVLSGRVDLAAVLVADNDRFIARTRETLEVIDGGAVRIVAALPPGSDDADDAYPLSALADVTLLLPRRMAAVPSLPEAMQRVLDFSSVEPGRVRTTSTLQASIPLIEAGVGVGALPDADGCSLVRFDIVVRPFDPEPEPLRLLVLTRPGASAANPALAGLLDTVHETIP